MADHTNEPKDAQPSRGKKYSAPTLTEYGSVAKLTMVKSPTTIEPPNQRKACL